MKGKVKLGLPRQEEIVYKGEKDRVAKQSINYLFNKYGNQNLSLAHSQDNYKCRH